MKKEFIPTPLHIDTLRRFKEQFGNRWKAALRECWDDPQSAGAKWAHANCCYNALLFIKNQAGESWLDNFNLASASKKKHRSYQRQSLSI